MTKHLVTLLILVFSATLVPAQDSQFSPIATVSAEQLGEMVFIEGKILSHRTPWNDRAPHILTISDGTGDMQVVFWDVSYNEMEAKGKLTTGALIAAYGEVNEYQGTLQINVENPEGIRLVKEGDQGGAVAGPSGPVSVGRINQGMVGSNVSFTATANSVREPGSATGPYIIQMGDGTGTIDVVFWPDLHDQLSASDKPAVGVTYDVKGEVDLFRDSIQIKPGDPADFKRATDQGAATGVSSESSPAASPFADSGNTASTTSSPFANVPASTDSPFGGSSESSGASASAASASSDSPFTSTGSSTASPFATTGASSASATPFGGGSGTTPPASPFGTGGSSSAAPASPFSSGSSTTSSAASPSPFGGGGSGSSVASASASPFGGGSASTTASGAAPSPFSGGGTTAASSSASPFGGASSSAPGASGASPFGGGSASAVPASPFGGGGATPQPSSPFVSSSAGAGSSSSGVPFGTVTPSSGSSASAVPFGAQPSATASASPSPFSSTGSATVAPAAGGPSPFRSSSSNTAASASSAAPSPFARVGQSRPEATVAISSSNAATRDTIPQGTKLAPQKEFGEDAVLVNSILPEDAGKIRAVAGEIQGAFTSSHGTLMKVRDDSGYIDVFLMKSAVKKLPKAQRDLIKNGNRIHIKTEVKKFKGRAELRVTDVDQILDVRPAE